MVDTEYVIQLIMSLFAALLALSLHEFAHAFAAYKLGDPTAKALGRLTLNPLKHLDLFGTLCMIFFHFGWAQPVPINARYFKKPRQYFAISALAGPMANVLAGAVFGFIYLCLINFLHLTENVFLNNLFSNTIIFVYMLHIINIGLGVFNLLPIPPFDGSRIVNVILPEKAYFKVMKYERYIYWGVVIWMLLGTYAYRFAMSFTFIAGSPVLSTIARALSLTTLITDIIDAISTLILKFFALLPFLNLPF